MYIDKVAVCSRSFSRHPILRKELLAIFPNATFNESGRQLEGDELISFLRGHTKAITGLEPITSSLLGALPDLKVISKYGVGTDMVDFSALRHSGISFGWTGGVNKRSVSELTLAFTIMMLRHVPLANQEVVSGKWRQIMGSNLTNKTFGIIGCGNVGKDLIKLLKPFDCKILVNDICEYPDFYSEYSVNKVSVNDLLAEADVVSLHVPLDSSTFNLINEDKFKLMKNTSVLINIARGGIIDELALKHALMSGRIAGAAFDVFDNEPPQDFELLRLPNFFATPHIGGSSEEAVLAMGRAAINGLTNNKIP